MQLAGEKLLWRLGCSADAGEIGEQIALTPDAARSADEMIEGDLSDDISCRSHDL
jgi:hypothetical protein